MGTEVVDDAEAPPAEIADLLAEGNRDEELTKELEESFREDKQPEPKKEEKKEEPKKEEKKEDLFEEDEEIDDVEKALRAEEEKANEELDKELEEFDDEQKATGIPKYSEIKQEFPDLFKKFPVLRDVFFRGTKVYEIFPNLEVAKVAAGKAQALDQLEDAIINKRDTEPLFKTLKDRGNLAEVAEQMLDKLWKVDNAVHTRVSGKIVGTVLDNLVKRATFVYNQGKEAKDERQMTNARDMMIAVRMLEGFLGWEPRKTREWLRTPAVTTAKEDAPEIKAIKEQNASLQITQFTAALDSVSETGARRINSYVERLLDPKGALPAGTKKWAIRDIFEQLDEAMMKDPVYSQRRDLLWKQAHSSGFSTESKSAILSAYLTRAKGILPGIIRKVRGDALGTLPIKEAPKESNQPKRIGGGRPTHESRGGKGVDPKQISRETSTLDILNDNITLRGGKRK